ncbi:MAG: T9SS type A sorting domain-containing protein, partial [Bacteroidales bacterium]|nr:T9SS type A sorting domain-containing protein [Bacteroidales bacterium]
PTKPSVIWRSVPDATKYEVECFDLSGISKGVKRNINATSLDGEEIDRIDDNMTLQYDTKYKLVVRAYKNNSLITCGSSVFTTKSEYHKDAKHGTSDYSEYASKTWSSGLQKYYGEPLGHFNNVIVYFNGNQENWQNTQPYSFCLGVNSWYTCTKFQCSNYSLRFFNEYQKLYIANPDNPRKAATFNLYANDNNGVRYVKTNSGEKPHIGDILIWERIVNGAYLNSHVAVVKEINGNAVTFVQQNSYPYEKTLDINNFGSNYIKGWLTPNVITLKFTEAVFSIRSDIQTSTSYKLIIKKLVGDCYTEIAGSPFNLDAASNSVSLSPGTYVARATGLTDKIQSNLIQFTISQPVEAIISQPRPFSIYTYENTANETRAAKASTNTDAVSNANIYQKIDTELIEKGYTDENGQLFAEFVPALQVGDVLVAEAEGYETLEGTVTQAMIDNNIISLLLNREVSAKIVNPQAQIVNYKPVFVEDLITFKVSAENLNAYRITLLPDCECEPDWTQSYAAGQNLVSLTGLHEGANTFEVSFFNEIDTLSLYRTVYYNPNATETNTYNIITIQATNESLGARLYVSGVFVKEIEHTGEVVVLPSGVHQLLFEKDGYKPYSEHVDISTTVNVDLKAVGASTAISSPVSNRKLVSIYPNPVNQLLHVGFYNGEDYTDTQLVLTNLNGQILYQITTKEQNHTINMQNFNSGVYLLTVKNSEGYHVEKIIKN